jgi:hypothetical protein
MSSNCGRPTADSAQEPSPRLGLLGASSRRPSEGRLRAARPRHRQLHARHLQPYDARACRRTPRLRRRARTPRVGLQCGSSSLAEGCDPPRVLRENACKHRSSGVLRVGRVGIEPTTLRTWHPLRLAVRTLLTSLADGSDHSLRTRVGPLTAEGESRTSAPTGLTRRIVAFNEAVYMSPLPTVTAVVLLAVGVAGAVGALLDDPDYWLFAAVLCFSAVLLFWATRTTREQLRLRAATSQPDPIAEGILDFYFAEDNALARIAVQRDVVVGPVRRERTRHWSRTRGARKVVEVGSERGGEDREVYELPGDVSTLLRELTRGLRDAGELETRLADIPTSRLTRRLIGARSRRCCAKDLRVSGPAGSVRERQKSCAKT